jgi:hypothetical protein
LPPPKFVRFWTMGICGRGISLVFINKKYSKYKV